MIMIRVSLHARQRAKQRLGIDAETLAALWPHAEPAADDDLRHFRKVVRAAYHEYRILDADTHRALLIMHRPSETIVTIIKGRKYHAQ